MSQKKKRKRPVVTPLTPLGTRVVHDPAQQASSFALDPRALHFAVNDTVVETRGDFPVYRPGDIWRMLQGTVFSK